MQRSQSDQSILGENRSRTGNRSCLRLSRATPSALIAWITSCATPFILGSHTDGSIISASLTRFEFSRAAWRIGKRARRLPVKPRTTPRTTPRAVELREDAEELSDRSTERVVPVLGIEEGGLHSAEALLLARYFMYTQLYFHPVRRIYDIHLKTFLKQWLGEGRFSTSLSDHLNLTHNEVMAAVFGMPPEMKSLPGHDPARRIVHREHFRTLYQRNPADVAENPDAAKAIYEAAACKFPQESVHLDSYKERKPRSRSPPRS